MGMFDKGASVSINILYTNYLIYFEKYYCFFLNCASTNSI